MAILRVAYNRKTKVATLYPIGAAAPDGSEYLGVTANGTTFYHSVQALLRQIGVNSMAPVSIVFCDNIAAPSPVVPEEPVVIPDPVEPAKKGIF